jgi:hypothetical protein
MIDFRGTNCGVRPKDKKSFTLDEPATETGFHFVGRNWQRQQRQRLISIKTESTDANCTLPTSRHFPQNVNLDVTNQLVALSADPI